MTGHRIYLCVKWPLKKKCLLLVECFFLPVIFAVKTRYIKLVSFLIKTLFYHNIDRGKTDLKSKKYFPCVHDILA